MPDNQNDVRPFASRFTEMLFSRYPEWKQYRVEPDFRWQAKDDLAVEVPSRFTPKCPLRIETMDDGIIISWLGPHTHCDDWGGLHSEDEFISEAFTIIEEILNEKLVVVITWNGGTGGTLHSDTIDQELQEGYWAKVAEKEQVVAVSWNGNYDRGQFDPAKC